MNILMPWNQDSSLNKQLVKLFSFSPYCVTLDHPSFRFAFCSPGTESILIGSELRNNSDGPLFLKLFKQSEKITTLVLLQYPFYYSFMKWWVLHVTIFTFTHILSILLKLNSISDALRSYLTQLVIAIFSSSHPSANSTSSPSTRLLTSFFSSQRLNLLSPRSIPVAKFEYKGIDMNTLARFFYFQQSKYYRKASESILSTSFFFWNHCVDIILSEYTRNGWSIVPLITQLIQETKEVAQPHTDEYYSLLMCIMMMLRDDITLATEDEAYLLDTIRDTMNDPGTLNGILAL